MTLSDGGLRCRDLSGERVLVLPHCPRGDPADPCQKPTDRRSSREQLPQGRPHSAPTRHARFRDEGLPAGSGGRGGRQRGAPRHGFSDDDIWDIAAIAAFFAMSNRLANFTSLRPNDEFYAL